MTVYSYPKDDAFVGDVKRPYQKLGLVRSRVNFNSLDWVHEEDQLCRNYYNKSVKELVSSAKEKGADAVIQVRSVVFLENGQSETYPTPECADDGEGGQILTEGIAVKWAGPDLKSSK